MFHKFMGIFALATIATAWTIPAGQTDGVYSVHVDETGKSVHTFLQDLAPTVSGFSATTHKSRMSRAASDNDHIWCGVADLNGANTRSACGGLDYLCNASSGVPVGQDIYSVSTSVAAYFCNLSNVQQYCSGDARATATNKVTAGCGSYIEGDDTDLVQDIVCGYQTVGSNFCGRGA